MTADHSYVAIRREDAATEQGEMWAIERRDVGWPTRWLREDRSRLATGVWPAVGVHRKIDPGQTLGGLAAVAVAVTLWKATTGRLLPVVVGVLVASALLLLTGGAIFLLYNPFMIWNPKVYYFDTIPNQIDLPNAIGAMVGAVVFSLIGALVPAAKAADTDPVKALRYE